MDLTDILYEKRNQAAWITLNRPQVLKAITPALIRSLRTAVEEALADHKVRVLVNTVVEPEALQTTVDELVQKLASRGPMAVSQIKQCFARNHNVDLESAILIENEAATACFVSEDQKEGLRAFLEKREPKWTGR
jgi:enoyl-CoA hydratase